MSISKAAAGLAAALVLGFAGAALAADKVPAGPGLGKEAPADLVAKWSISILPDGTGLPAGKGDSRAGAMIYVRTCLGCHGTNGGGGTGGRLTGGIGSLTSDNPIKTVNSYWPYATTIFDYIRRAMPITAPQSLTDDEVYALVAYILSVDGIVKITDPLDKDTLPKIQMPNRNGFVSFWPAAPKGF